VDTTVTASSAWDREWSKEWMLCLRILGWMKKVKMKDGADRREAQMDHSPYNLVITTVRMKSSTSFLVCFPHCALL
jgi:hypothetical protein